MPDEEDPCNFSDLGVHSRDVDARLMIQRPGSQLNERQRLNVDEPRGLFSACDPRDRWTVPGVHRMF
jgi:hypothetical protein